MCTLQNLMNDNGVLGTFKVQEISLSCFDFFLNLSNQNVLSAVLSAFFIFNDMLKITYSIKKGNISKKNKKIFARYFIRGIMP